MLQPEHHLCQVVVTERSPDVPRSVLERTVVHVLSKRLKGAAGPAAFALCQFTSHGIGTLVPEVSIILRVQQQQQQRQQRRHLQGVLELVLEGVELPVEPAELAPHDVCGLHGVLHRQPAGKGQKVLALLGAFQSW